MDMRRAILTGWSPLIIALAATVGCEPPPGPEMTATLRDELAAERRKNHLLAQQMENLAAQVRHQNQQLATLETLGDKRLDVLFRVERIEIGRHSGGLNTDEQPGHDVLKLFVNPIDQTGSVLKRAGAFTIDLYDLALPPGDNRIAHVEIPADNARGHFQAGMLAYHYSFTLPLDPPPAHDELTVRVSFTDYLTGRTFTAQKALSITLPPPTTQPASQPASPPAAATLKSNQ